MQAKRVGATASGTPPQMATTPPQTTVFCRACEEEVPLSEAWAHERSARHKQLEASTKRVDATAPGTPSQTATTSPQVTMVGRVCEEEVPLGEAWEHGHSARHKRCLEMAEAIFDVLMRERSAKDREKARKFHEAEAEERELQLRANPDFVDTHIKECRAKWRGQQAAKRLRGERASTAAYARAAFKCEGAY